MWKEMWQNMTKVNLSLARQGKFICTADVQQQGGSGTCGWIWNTIKAVIKIAIKKGNAVNFYVTYPVYIF